MAITLIAIAALAATGAFAQSTVTISGSFESGLQSLDMKGQKATGIAHNLSSTSGIAFTGVSDLGGGLKADFKLGSDFNPATSHGNQGASTGGVASVATFGNAENKLGIAGSMGKLTLGAMNNIALEAATMALAGFGTAVGGGYGVTSTVGGSGVRSDNSFRLDTANYGGISATWIARKQNAITGGAANAYAGTATATSYGAYTQSQVSQVGLRYNAGPLNAIIIRAMDDAQNVAGGDKQVLNAIAANYNMGDVTVYGGYQGQKTTTVAGIGKRDTTALTFGAKYAMGANTFMAQYGRTSGATQARAAATVAQGGVGFVGVGETSNAATTLGLGYEYALSKTAAITARYERNADHVNLNAVNVAAAGYTATGGSQDRTRMGVGLRVAF
jgi:predicted porin